MRKKILNLIVIIVASFLCFWGASKIGRSKSEFEAILMTFYAVAYGGIAGLIFAFVFGDRLGNWFGFSIFWASGKVNPPPPDFSFIRVKITQGDYTGAETDLRSLLEADNGNPYVVALLAELFIDKMRDFRKAEALLTSYLSKDGREPSDLKFAMMLADLYVERGDDGAALGFLKMELKKSVNKQSIKSLEKRIAALS